MSGSSICCTKPFTPSPQAQSWTGSCRTGTAAGTTGAGRTAVAGDPPDALVRSGTCLPPKASVCRQRPGCRPREERLEEGSADGAGAAHHLRDGEWLALAAGATVNGAFASIAAHVERTGDLPAWCSPETDAAVRAAAAEILVGAPAFLMAA